MKEDTCNPVSTNETLSEIRSEVFASTYNQRLVFSSMCPIFYILLKIWDDHTTMILINQYVSLICYMKKEVL